MNGLRGFWYIGCASSRLRNQPLSIRVLDKQLVLFRDAEGTARALRDRCCHRGAKLSGGRRVEGTIECPYHGWRFAGCGSCTHIPSLVDGQRIPGGAGVPSFHCAERDGYVWVYVAREAEEPETPPPGILGFERYHWLQGSIEHACAFQDMVENNLDITHAAFVHPWTHAWWYRRKLKGLIEREMELRINENGITTTWPATSSADESIPEDVKIFGRWELPDRIHTRARSGSFEFHAWLHFVPTGEETCRLEFMYRNPSPLSPKVRWMKKEPRLFRQDRELMERAHEARQADGPLLERSVPADEISLTIRRILELASGGLWEEKRDSLPSRRIIQARY